VIHVFDGLLQVSDVLVLCLGKTVLELNKLTDIVDLVLVALDQAAHAINFFAHIVNLLHRFGCSLKLEL
jgi:hypothetical protein